MHWIKQDINEAVKICFNYPTGNAVFGIDLFISNILANSSNGKSCINPVSVSWEVTGQCNLNCKHCYQSRDASSQSILNTNQCIELIKQLKDFQIVQVTLTGGEPLLRDDLITIVAAIKEAKIGILLQTNGLLFHKDMINAFKKLFIPGIDIIQISLDGACAKTHNLVRGADVFLKTCKSINELSNQQLDVIVSCCPTMINQKEIPDIYKLASELGAIAFQATPLAIFYKNQKHLVPDQEILFKAEAEIIQYSIQQKVPYYLGGISGEYLSWVNFPVSRQFLSQGCNPESHWTCGGLHSKLHISSNGIVYPCVFATKQRLGNGNVPDTPLAKLWESRFDNPYHSGRPQREMPCWNCKWNAGCQGGCPGLAEELTGNILHCDPRCNYGIKLKENEIKYD